MDNLQYSAKRINVDGDFYGGFKPYYKWIIFNINKVIYTRKNSISFKPYYKWIIFNIDWNLMFQLFRSASFKPYYKWIIFNIRYPLNS